ncbi:MULTISPECIES: hypothetical protein [unclassified Paenibacillus]|uniref:hypothetical protein n=1 Tax=unclassified Paenibacillus TaxID=185978 RepID=UPI00089B14D2|nr:MULTISPECIES: hypothetical protein [unclassified Paenibacillus]OMC68676.1 hypothetical protein BK126_12740 [Paenibacillus sp. FSL H7-0326]SDW55337.1 hypothetical protein SAMN05518848_102144 [Paenibacillus sp. PDC88]
MMNKAITMPKFEKEAKKRADSKKVPENIKMSVNDKNKLVIEIDLNVIDKEPLVLGEKSARVASTLGGIRLKKDGFQNVVLNLNAYIPVDEYVSPVQAPAAPATPAIKAPTGQQIDMDTWEQFQQFLKFQEMMVQAAKA